MARVGEETLLDSGSNWYMVPDTSWNDYGHCHDLVTGNRILIHGPFRRFLVSPR